MCQNCEYEEWLNNLDLMLETTDEFRWAENTLLEIQNFIATNDHITERQKQSIMNIFNKGSYNNFDELEYL